MRDAGVLERLAPRVYRLADLPPMVKVKTDSRSSAWRHSDAVISLRRCAASRPLATSRNYKDGTTTVAPASIRVNSSSALGEA